MRKFEPLGNFFVIEITIVRCPMKVIKFIIITNVKRPVLPDVSDLPNRWTLISKDDFCVIG
jgi:hypothetical protein